jgi:hypothetical protein
MFHKSPAKSGFVLQVFASTHADSSYRCRQDNQPFAEMQEEFS